MNFKIVIDEKMLESKPREGGITLSREGRIKWTLDCYLPSVFREFPEEERENIKLNDGERTYKFESLAQAKDLYKKHNRLTIIYNGTWCDGQPELIKKLFEG